MANKTPGARWGWLSGLDNTSDLEWLARMLGAPQPHTTVPPYRAGVFQVIVQEDGYWIHACLLRRYRSYRFWKDFGELNDIP